MDNNNSWLGRYENDLKPHNPISFDDERHLLKKINCGDVNSRNKLITSNLKLVPLIAKNYIGRGLSINELICEGNKGLVVASLKYKDQGYRFSAYAVHWIKQAILMAIKKDNQYKLMNESDFEMYSDIYQDDENELNQIEYQDERYKQIINIVAELDNKKAKIVKHYFGVMGCEKLNTLELSKKYKLSPMRISKIIEDSIRMIRCSYLEQNN